MKYSIEIANEICDYVEGGSTQKDAAIMCGIVEETFYAWRKEKSEFSESLKKAHANHKKTLLKTIADASDKSWQAAAWILERRYKEDYSLRQELTGKDGDSLFGNMSNSQMEDMVAKIKTSDK